MDYGVTKDGFVKKRFDTIYEEIQADIAEGTGVDISLNPKSYLNVLMSSVADKITAVWEVAEAVYYSLFPSTAEGMNLDYACEFSGITRSEGTPTKYYILCTGSDGAAIPAGTRIASDTSPKYYFTVSTDQVITRSAFNKATIRTAGDVEAGTAYQLTLEGTAYSYIYDANDAESDYAEFISTLDGDKDVSGYKEAITIYSELAKVINKSGQSFTASVEMFTKDADNGSSDEYPVLSIASTAEYVNYSYDLPENKLTSNSVTSIILFESEDLDDVTLPANTITVIENSMVTNNDGFQSCTNLAVSVSGKARESDAELRQSYLAKQAYRASTTLDSIKAAILTYVPDVLSVAAFENDTEENPDANGLPCHSIAVIVDGGEESDIAEIILKYKPAGIGTYAVESNAHHVEVPTGENSSITINYSDPIPIYVHLDVILEANPDEAMPTTNNLYVSLTKDAIKEYTDSITSGQNVIIQKAITNINSSVPGIAYIGIVATWTSDSGDENKTKKYITVDAWHKAYFENDGVLDITVYMYDTGGNLNKEGYLYKDSNGVYYHTNEETMYASGVYYDAEGNYIEQTSDSVSAVSIALTSTTDSESIARFEACYYDSNGILMVDADNVYYRKSSSKDDNGKISYEPDELIDAGGKYLIDNGDYISGGSYYSNSMPIVDSDGKYYYSDGSTMYDNGIYYNSSKEHVDAGGDYYDSDGNLIVDTSGNYYNGNGVLIIDSEGNYYDSNGVIVVDSKNNYYMADGATVYVNINSWISEAKASAAAETEDTESDIVCTLDGATIITMDGIINDRAGNKIMDTNSNVYDRDGNLITNALGNFYDRAGKLIKDKKGNYYYGDSNCIIDTDGNYYDGAGNKIRDAAGNYYIGDAELIKDADGNYYYGEDNVIADANGNYFLNGIKVKDKDGNFYHRDDGKLIKDAEGNFYDGAGNLIIDTAGNCYDDYGDVIPLNTEDDDG